MDRPYLNTKGWSLVLPIVALVSSVWLTSPQTTDADGIRQIQFEAMRAGSSPVAHWGLDPKVYCGWRTHSLRLVPVYAYGTGTSGVVPPTPGTSLSNAPVAAPADPAGGVSLRGYMGPHSAYRTEDGVRQLYGKVPVGTLNPRADYMDQTDLALIQRAALESGRKHIILFIFDGMDWFTTWAAAINNRKSVMYREGRGTGTHFQDYDAQGTAEFGYMVTAPLNEGTDVKVDVQELVNPGGRIPGGYNAELGGPNPWTLGTTPAYLIGRGGGPAGAAAAHAVPDSAATATAMTTGVKSYNQAINFDGTGNPVTPVAHEAQERGLAVGVVTSVPFDHATPACAYAQNVDRDDYQDLGRDMLGLPSITHPKQPLPGLDVVLGCGFGVTKLIDLAQGSNYVLGNPYLTAEDRRKIDVAAGGKYVVAERKAGRSGATELQQAAERAAATNARLFGFYGVYTVGRARGGNGHLPFRTANGDFRPTFGGTLQQEQYSTADLFENPSLAEMTSAALTVLSKNPRGFWLMVEAGDVDWANHDDNLDNSIGAVNSGDAAVKVITDWVERNSNWQESLMIVTADHGHMLVIDRPELLARGAEGEDVTTGVAPLVKSRRTKKKESQAEREAEPAAKREAP